jgi:hypothetical protein
MMIAVFLLSAAQHVSPSGEGMQPSHTEDASFLSPLEKGVVEEINVARGSPGNYRRILERNRIYYRGNRLEKPGGIPIVTKEGIAALDEAVRYLGRAPSSPPLAVSRGMSLGARDLVTEQQSSGAVGHAGRNGKGADDRVNRYGTWVKSIGENIEYGSNEAGAVVMNLIVDDGVPGRGHRTNLMNSEFTVIGVACGTHPTYRHMCVLTFAGAYKENAGASLKPISGK